MVFKEKLDGQFWARLVALGYPRVPGINYSKIYAQWHRCDVQSVLNYYTCTKKI